MLLIVFPRLMECDIAPDASLVVMITFNMQHKHVKQELNSSETSCDN
jgi:hypothetical protein